MVEEKKNARPRVWSSAGNCVLKANFLRAAGPRKSDKRTGRPCYLESGGSGNKNPRNKKSRSKNCERKLLKSGSGRRHQADTYWKTYRSCVKNPCRVFEETARAWDNSRVPMLLVNYHGVHLSRAVSPLPRNTWVITACDDKIQFLWDRTYFDKLRSGGATAYQRLANLSRYPGLVSKKKAENIVLATNGNAPLFNLGEKFCVYGPGETPFDILFFQGTRKPRFLADAWVFKGREHEHRRLPKKVLLSRLLKERGEHPPDIPYIIFSPSCLEFRKPRLASAGLTRTSSYMTRGSRCYAAISRPRLGEVISGRKDWRRRNARARLCRTIFSHTNAYVGDVVRCSLFPKLLFRFVEVSTNYTVDRGALRGYSPSVSRPFRKPVRDSAVTIRTWVILTPISMGFERMSAVRMVPKDWRKFMRGEGAKRSLRILKKLSSALNYTTRRLIFYSSEDFWLSIPHAAHFHQIYVPFDIFLSGFKHF